MQYRKLSSMMLLLLLLTTDGTPLQAAGELSSGVGRLYWRIRLQQMERNDDFRCPQDADFVWTRDMNQAAGIESIFLQGDVTPRTQQTFTLASNLSAADNHRRFLLVQRYPQPTKLLTRLESSKPVIVPGTDVQGFVVDPTIPTEQVLIAEYVVRFGQTWTHTHYMTADHNWDRTSIVRYNVNFEGIQTEVGGSGNETIMIPPGQVIKFWNGNHFQYNPGRAWARSGAGQNNANNLRDSWSLYLAGPSKVLTAADAPRAQNLQVFYVRDGHTNRFLDWDGAVFDNTGKPRIGNVFARSPEFESGEWMADANAGYMLLHFDQSGGDETDRFNPTDPANHAPTTGFDRNVNRHWGSTSATERWNFMTTPGYLPLNRYTLGATTGPDWQTHFETLGINTASVASRPVWTSQMFAGSQKRLHIVSGPAVMNMGQDHDYIMAWGVGDLPRKERIDYGWRYLTWLAQQKPSVHPKGEGTGLTPISDVEKYQILDGVKDTLFTVLDNAHFAFHGGRNSGLTIQQKKEGEGLRRMPAPPRAPNVFFAEGPTRCDIRAWYDEPSGFDDFNTGVDDFLEWRVYRKKGRPDVLNVTELENFGYLDWEVIARVSHQGAVNGQGQPLTHVAALTADHYNAEYEFRDGTIRRVFEFFDLNVTLGDDYFYAVTVADDGSQNMNGIKAGESMESSRYAGWGTILSGATRPFTPGLALTDSAVIVPNPWSLDLGAAKYSGIDPNKILFDKLPHSCKLRIYTETGDLVYEIDHGPGSLGYLTAQEVWNQQTLSTQLVRSGIYILAVLESKEVDLATNAVIRDLPDQFLKFVIIR